MEQKDILKLFFSKAYEKQLNMNILNDIEYVIPLDGILNYVAELIGVHYDKFVEHIVLNPNDNEILSENITQSSSFSACECEMVQALLDNDNTGFDYVGIGRLFPQYVTSANIVSYRKYGENQIKTAAQLGLVFEFYKVWYLNCIGYIYNDLDKEDQNSLLARCLLRDPLYNQMVRDILTHDIDIVSYMVRLDSPETKLRRYDSVERLLNICLKECDKIGINHYHIINTRNALVLLVKQAKKDKKKKEKDIVFDLAAKTDNPISLVANHSNSFDDYLTRFSSLHCYKKNGINAPYKALMLISVINLVQRGVIKENRIVASEELKNEYVQASSIYDFNRDLFKPSFDNPFIHLSGDGFWHIRRKNIEYDEMKSPISKVSEIEYVSLDDELFSFIKDAHKCDSLVNVLMNTYLHD